ncbi:MAG: IS66 family insertion sequence element accessory protein TnpB [Bacteroidaceae bacterium]|nr:IS66 family insertion sequence element accessory protein TnpB [Bacteroidaceae bacterium]
MRCKTQTISEIIRSRYSRDPHNGDVYVFMSKNCKRIRLIHY